MKVIWEDPICTRLHDMDPAMSENDTTETMYDKGDQNFIKTVERMDLMLVQRLTYKIFI